MSRPKISTLILLRHGESIWNGAPETRFTGWCDVPLTVKRVSVSYTHLTLPTILLV